MTRNRLPESTEVCLGDCEVLCLAISGTEPNETGDMRIRVYQPIEKGDIKSAIEIFKLVHPNSSASIDSALVQIDLEKADPDLLKKASSVGQVFVRFKSMTEMHGVKNGDIVKIYKCAADKGYNYFELRKM